MYLFYETAFALSLMLTGFYVLIWNKHYDININIIFMLIPITNLGYFILSLSENLREAIVAQKMIYAGGCFLSLFAMMCVFNLCEIKINRVLRFFCFFANAVLFLLVLTIGHRTYYYKEVYFNDGPGDKLIKVYGPAHTLFYVLTILFIFAAIAAIIYTFHKKKQISTRILLLLFFPCILTFIGFFGNVLFGHRIDIMPANYILAQVMYLLIVRRMSLYNVSEMVIESMVQTGETGFISVDLKDNYLGSNATAREIIPELKQLRVDFKISKIEKIEHWIKFFKEDNNKKSNVFTKKNPDNPNDIKYYKVEVNYLYDGIIKRGYQVFIKDDTPTQKYMKVIEEGNYKLSDDKNLLEEMVKEKTKHIIEMHDNLILSMAMMVESRDNSTGGHIRRTSVGVRILIDEILKDNELKLDEDFCANIIKAAPMHDIGKIAVDDQILRKPGRFTDEEFKKMQIHSAEGARIVHEILKDTDNESFKKIAENVAHFHHERWDGSGYPEKLEGENIPLEARIMAIADVYDALVSKRVYKESMSFEEADGIIMKGMGSQFDPKLEKYYVAAKPRLEEYYSKQDN